MIRPLHPFPARMAPDLAIREIRSLKQGAIVLDPMSGSGTVLREACEQGHRAVGFDVDPLAVLMARVWTTPVRDGDVADLALEALRIAKRGDPVAIPWIDSDRETAQFVSYWFAGKQRRMLRRLANALQRLSGRQARGARALDVLRLALSRIIVTKDAGASLARDVSHSRPHRVADTSTFDVLAGFERSVESVRKLLREAPPARGVRVRLGDARRMPVSPQSADLVLTSPPYLNAIDYLRAHRLALVWLGYTIPELRRVRAEAIGTERGADGGAQTGTAVRLVSQAMASKEALSPRHCGMVERYADDLVKLMTEIRRTLRANGRAVLVVGNSCLRGTFIRNSSGVVVAARQSGLRLKRSSVRELPESKRYLPLRTTNDPALGKRMRTESVLTFVRSEDY